MLAELKLSLEVILEQKKKLLPIVAGIKQHQNPLILLKKIFLKFFKISSFLKFSDSNQKSIWHFFFKEIQVFINVHHTEFRFLFSVPIKGNKSSISYIATRYRNFTFLNFVLFIYLRMMCIRKIKIEFRQIFHDILARFTIY